MLEGDFFHDAGQAESKDVKASIKKYLSYWYLFLLGVLLSVGGAYAYLSLATPQYHIGSTLLIKDITNGYGPDESAVFSELNMVQSGNTIDNEIIMLKSKALMHRVLTELGLYTNFYKEDKFNDKEIYGSEVPVLVDVIDLTSEAYGKRYKLTVIDSTAFKLEEQAEDRNFAATNHLFGEKVIKPGVLFSVNNAFGPVPLVKNEEVIIEFNNISSLAGNYSSKLSITQVNKNTSILSISMRDPVREKGKDIINKLMEVYEKEAFEDKNLIVSTSISFIDERLKYLTAELSDVEKDVEKFKRENKLTDVESEATMYSESANEYNKRLIEHDTQTEILASIETYIRNQKENQFELVPSTLNIHDPTLGGLIAKFNELQLERQRMLRSMSPEHPLILNINEQLLGLKDKILENLRMIKRGLSITRQNIMASSSQFETKKGQVPVMERELLEINRQQGVKSGLYLYLLQKREESGLSLATTSANSKIIERAEASWSPVSPNHQTIYLMAILAGLLIPFAFVYVKEMLNDKVGEQRDVKRLTNTPILGEICTNKEKEFVVVKENSRSFVAEMFRHMRANLQFATVGKENRVIMVTSSISGEGKTFFSINLAASLVLSGKRVVVLGMDLRQPRLLRELGLNEGKGITNYLVSDEVTVDDIVVESQILPDLFVVGSGTLPPNPGELLLSPKVEKLLNILKESFDYIIIDTAPVGLVADAFNLAPYIDSTIYVVRYNYTQKNHIDIIDTIYKQKKFQHPMIVLNGAKVETTYGKGYGYGYVIENEEKNKSINKKVS